MLGFLPGRPLEKGENKMNLVDSAKEYWSQVVPVVPLKGKQPLVEWARWQTKTQTKEEFDTLPWDKADGFAIICGVKTKDGFYVGALDFDVKNLPPEVVEKGKQALKNFPITQIEETPSKGQHWIYYCTEKPVSVSAFHNICALEVLGEGKLCVMAPSAGYRKLNDNTPTIINGSLEDVFFATLERAGVEVEKPNRFWFDSRELAVQPYRGKNPPCILSLTKGTVEGQRNEYAVRLASFWANFRQYSPETVLKRLKQWNKLNQPPLAEKELESVLKSALQGGYVFGCMDPMLKANCNRDACPIAPKITAKILTEGEKARAEALLEDSTLLEYVAAYGRRSLIGEDNILKLNFVAMCSGQTRYPISMVLSGYSGSGKNQSIDAIKALIPSEWLFSFTTSTPEAIKYIPENFTGTLCIYEYTGVKSKEGSTGTIGLRAIGEGKGIETIYPVRDEETGRIRLEHAKTSARNFITTESDVDIHPDMYRRVFKASMNFSDQLTVQVMMKKIMDASMPESLREKLKLNSRGEKIPYSEKDFQNALRLLDWNAEVVVFPVFQLLNLMEYAEKKEQKVALRGQTEKIIDFIRVLAILHQKQRFRVQFDDGSLYVVAAPEDVENALAILTPVLAETVSRIDKRMAEALDAIDEDTPIDKNRLAEKIGISSATAYRVLKALSRHGYLAEHQKQKPYTYTLIKKPSKHIEITSEMGNYRRFWEINLKSWLDGVVSTLHSGICKPKILEPKITFKQASEPDKSWKLRLKSNSGLAENEAPSTAVKCETMPTKAFSSSIKEEKSGNTVSGGIAMRDEFLFRYIKPGKPCELCGQHAVEVEIKTPYGAFTRCMECWQKLREQFKNVHWIEEREEA